MSSNERENFREGTAIARVTAGALIAALFTERGTRGNIVDLVAANPTQALPALLNLAYHRPSLFEPRQGRPLRPQLSEIRTAFPAIIAAFDDKLVRQALQNNPAMQQRLESERAILASALPEGERAGIKACEIILRMLIEDGSPNQLQGTTVNQVVTSHEAYIGLLDAIEQRGVQLPDEEERRFLDLGQNLGMARRTLMVSPEVLVQEPDYQKSEKDFQGRVAQIRALSLLIGRLSKEGGNQELIKRLAGEFEEHAERLPRLYPDRINEIAGVVNIKGLNKLSAYVIEPGAAELSAAELRHTEYR